MADKPKGVPPRAYKSWPIEQVIEWAGANLQMIGLHPDMERSELIDAMKKRIEGEKTPYDPLPGTDDPPTGEEPPAVEEDVEQPPALPDASTEDVTKIYKAPRGTRYLYNPETRCYFKATEFLLERKDLLPLAELPPGAVSST